MTVLLVVFCSTVIAYDLLFRRVPNWLLLAAIGVQAGWLVVAGHGLEDIDIWQSLTGGIVGLIVFLPLYALRVMGAGDVKFFAVLGLLMGINALLPVWLIGSVLAGVHGLTWYAANNQLIAFPEWHLLAEKVNSNDWYQAILKRREGRQGIPYAAYLAIGAIIVSVY